MLSKPFFTENELDEWVRGHAQEAQGKIVELIYRLVAASVPRPQERRFPLSDSIGQHGPDGKLVTNVEYNPFVPLGLSLWEIGTNTTPGAKATSDYTDLTAAVPVEIRRDATFIFVTPLSGRRAWQGTWKPDQQEHWVNARRGSGDWRDVKVMDASVLIDWLQQFPSVAKWFAIQMGKSTAMVDSAEQRWLQNAAIGEPPPLSPDIFLANRTDACNRLDDLFNGAQQQLQLDTHFSRQVADFVSAYLASLDVEVRIERQGRCLIVPSADSWESVCALRDPHVLVADFDMTGEDAPRLLAVAKKARHGVVYAALPGGEPNPFRQLLLNPRSYQMEEALVKAGYKRERARVLSQRSDSNLSSLLRCIQGLSAMPEWSSGDAAGDLKIMEMLGSFDSRQEADRKVAEALLGKAFGEWTENLRKVAAGPATPLTVRDSKWKMVARYEGWYALGPLISDDLLDSFKAQALKVLGEIDPKFELPGKDRFAANIYGKSLRHSEALRKGVAETLALLGSHPGSLTMCSRGKAEATASSIVSETLASGDWMLWASINRYLPLLAEAAPKAFSDSVDKALDRDPTPFDDVFAQEGDGITGDNHMTGLLWALESLAWDPNSLTRTTLTLGRLASRDPGGKWANRPIGSLTMIYLPWLPQTTASIEQRRASIATLIREMPDIGWKLLLNLLPQGHMSSHGTHRPTWRDIGDLQWEKGVTHGEYWTQVAGYAEMATSLAIQRHDRLLELVKRIDDLPVPALERVLAHLASDQVGSLPEDEREPIWDELSNVVTKHRKFSDAQWAMPKEWVDKIATVTDKLAPSSPLFKYARLFGNRDFEVYDEKESIEAQHLKLEARRDQAITEVLEAGGIEGVIQLVSIVETPWRVGHSLGRLGNENTDRDLLPTRLEEADRRMEVFISGYISMSYYTRGEQWADSVVAKNWTQGQVVAFLLYLPFTPWTWNKVAALLGEAEREFWTRTNASAFETKEDELPAVQKLMEYGRPVAALRLIYREVQRKRRPGTDLIADALIAAIASTEEQRHMDYYEIGELIKLLQSDNSADQGKLYTIEWGYSDLFIPGQGLHPVALEKRLASDPAAFCELMKIVYRSKNDTGPKPEHTEKEKRFGVAAWRVLHDWQTPPGIQSDGSFNGQQLKEWTDYALKSAVESGHLEVCQSLIGKVLIHTPPDPDGLWINRTAAELLNGKDSEEMRSGYMNAEINSRGVHWVDPSGAQELGLAVKYRDRATAVEAAGFHRFAESLRKLAEGYELEAKDVIENANLED